MSAYCRKNLFFITILFLVPNLHAEVYKWTDENGKIHFSDKPINEKSAKIKIKKPPTKRQILNAKKKASTLINHQNKVQEMIDEETKNKKEKEKLADKKQQDNINFCKKAKQEIIYLGGRYINYTTDKNGKRHYMTDKEVNTEAAKIEASMKGRCE